MLNKHKTKGTKHLSNPPDATRRGQIIEKKREEGRKEGKEERKKTALKLQDMILQYIVQGEESVVQIHYLINICVIFFYTNDYFCVQRQKKKKQ